MFKNILKKSSLSKHELLPTRQESYQKTLNYKEKCYDFLNSNEVEGF